MPPFLTPGIQWVFGGHGNERPRHVKFTSVGSDGAPCEYRVSCARISHPSGIGAPSNSSSVMGRGSEEKSRGSTNTYCPDPSSAPPVLGTTGFRNFSLACSL